LIAARAQLSICHPACFRGHLAMHSIPASLFVLSVLFFGCSKAQLTKAAPPTPAPAIVTSEPLEEPAAPKSASTAAADDEDCTFATPLVAGTPGSPGHLIKSSRNPNGDSELAVMMRQFVDDIREARTLLEAGKPVKALYPTYRKMRCAWMTKPAERNQMFDDRAVAYLGLVKAYDASPSQATYNGIIAGCISCHSQSCGGPLDFIDSMKWQ
jgi:hypothetical protein